MDEINNQKVLFDNERKLLLDAYNKLQYKSFKNLNYINKKKPIEEQKIEKELWKIAKTQVKKGRLIAELTLGFWINLCKKSYKNNLWDKKDFFANVFYNFDNHFITTELDKTKIIFPELKNILNLRNRIFHHEIIINNKIGIENCYDKIEKVLYSLSEEYAKTFIHTFRFKELIKQKP